jgi:Tol biopolymer transport system component
MDLSSEAWSPDGRRLVYLSKNYTSFDRGIYSFQLRTINADGSKDRRLLTIDRCCGTPKIAVAGQWVYAPAWSPDGRSIAFVSSTIVCLSWGACGVQSSLMRVGIDGKQLETLAVDAASNDEPKWSPDGKRIAYTSATGVSVVGADGIGLPVRVNPLDQMAWAPAWSRDGRLAYLATEQTDVIYPQKGDIWVARPDGTGRRRLPATSFDPPSWSPDSRWIAFSDGGIKVVGSDGKSARRVTSPNANFVDVWPRWSPSGARIAFTRQAIEWGIPSTLWTVAAGGSSKPRSLGWFTATSPTYAWAPR